MCIHFYKYYTYTDHDDDIFQFDVDDTKVPKHFLIGEEGRRQLIGARRLVPLNRAASRSLISKLWNWHPQQMG